MKVLAAVALACLAIAPACAAQNQAPPAPGSSPTAAAAPPAVVATTAPNIDPAKEADIRKLLDLVGTTALVQQVVQRMEQSLTPVLTNSLPPGEYRDQLIQLFFQKFNSKFDSQQLIDLTIRRYDENFSDEEIKGLIQFYQTPLGQKVATVLPKMLAELQADGGKMGREIGRESMIEVLQEHPDLAQKLQHAAAQKAGASSR